MYDASISLIEIAIGNFLKTEIKFISAVVHKMPYLPKNDNTDNTDIRKVVVLGLENLYFFSEDFNELLQKINFKDITEIIIADDDDLRLLKIIYSPLNEIVLNIRRRKLFIDKITSYYMIYCMEKDCSIREIKVKKNSEMFHNLDEKNSKMKLNDDLYDSVFKRCPKNYILTEYQGYMY